MSIPAVDLADFLSGDKNKKDAFVKILEMHLSRLVLLHLKVMVFQMK